MCRCDVLAESCTRRGVGLTVKTRCPLHLNVTAALLDTLSDMQKQLTQLLLDIDADTLWRRVDVVRAARTAPGASDDSDNGSLGTSEFGLPVGNGDGNGVTAAASRGEYNQISRYRHREMVEYHDLFNSRWPADVDLARGIRSAAPGYSNGRGGGAVTGAPALFPVCHQFAAPLPLESRMSFTILNLTGQTTRYFQPRAGEETRYLRYLRVRCGPVCVLFRVPCCTVAVQL